MDSPKELEAAAKALEDEVTRLEEEGRPLAAQAKLQEAATLRKNALLLRQQHSGLSGSSSCSAPLTIIIAEDDDAAGQPYKEIFDNKEDFRAWRAQGSIKGLKLNGFGPLITTFEELADGATYSVVTHGLQSDISQLKGAARHLVNRREDEFAAALRTRLLHEGYDPSELHLRPELRQLFDSDGVAKQEFDVVLLTGRGEAFLGSHKSHVKDVGEVLNLVDSAEELQEEAQKHEPSESYAPFKDRKVQLTFMAEHVSARAKVRLPVKCKEYGVRLFRRNGVSITQAHSRVMPSLWKFAV